MSMYTIMSGSFEIEPPLSHQELKALPDFRDIHIKVVETETETSEGTLIRRTGTEICLNDEDSRSRNYFVDDELRIVFTKFARTSSGEPRSFNGSIFCIYEEIQAPRFTPVVGDTAEHKQLVPIIDGIFRFREQDGRLITEYPVIDRWVEKEKEA